MGDIEENRELIKSCFVKQGDITRKTLLEKHKKNLEFEKDLKLGVFGKNTLDKSKNKILRIVNTPATYNS